MTAMNAEDSSRIPTVNGHRRQNMAKGIFIEGMQKPTHCGSHCVFADRARCYDCILIDSPERFPTFEEQYECCPLREVEIPLTD